MEILSATCSHCNREFKFTSDCTNYLPILARSWVGLVCKRCVCLARAYHRWTVNDLGAIMCRDCFIPRRPLVSWVAIGDKMRRISKTAAIEAKNREKLLN